MNSGIDEESRKQARHHYRAADEKLDAGDLDGVIEECTKAVQIDSNLEVAFYVRGNAYKLKGNLEAAISDYDRTIELSPGFINAYYARAFIYINHKNDPQAAAANFTQIIEMIPSDFKAHIYRAFSREKINDFDGAINDYSEAIRLDPTDIQLYIFRGLSREKINDFDGAINDYSEILRIDSQSRFAKDAYRMRGYLLEDQNDLEGALADYQAWIALDPQDADGYFYRGLTYSDLDDFENAIADLQKYLDLGGAGDAEDQTKCEEWIKGWKEDLAEADSQDEG